VLTAIGFFAVFGFGVLGFMILVLWVFSLIDLSKRPDLDRRQRMTWVLLIVLLPIVGAIVYLVRRPLLPDEREKALRDYVNQHR
jgi:Phospholipase_D-nuclease N-terminal